MSPFLLEMMLNLHHLRIFRTVADTGSFTRAAELLRLSQPAVSKSVRAMERQLSTPLFDRAHGAPTLTQAGTMLLARAHELFAVERAAEQELLALSGGRIGELRVAASTTVVTYVLPAFLARFQRAHPEAKLRVLHANTRDVARALLERRVEVALVEGPVQHEQLELVPWKADELVVICSPDHEMARRSRVPVRELADLPFIVRERGSGTRRVADEALCAHGVVLRVALQLASTEAIKQAVAAGLGMAIVSRATLGDQLSLGRLAVIELEGVRLERQFSELRFRNRPESALARALRGILGLPVQAARA
jgi:DNA-binding transcriptional LysR family regulator